MTSVFEKVTMFFKRVIIKYNYQRVKNSNRLEDHIRFVLTKVLEK